VSYLTSDFSSSSLIFTMAGTNTVTSGINHADIFRVNGLGVLTTGTGYKAAGNITLKYTTGSAVQGYIPIGKTFSRQAFYTVPKDKNLYVINFSATCAGSKYLVFTLHMGSNPNTGTINQRGLFYPGIEYALLNSSFNQIVQIPRKIPATADLKVSVVSESTGSIGTCNMAGWLETI